MAKVTKDDQSKPSETVEEAPADESVAAAVDAPLESAEETVPEALVASVPPPQTGDRLVCPTCGLDALVERRTPNHATHYTVVCNHCGYRATFAD